MLVGYFDDEINKRVVDAVTKAGYEAVPVRTGKDVPRRDLRSTTTGAIAVDVRVLWQDGAEKA